MQIARALRAARRHLPLILSASDFDGLIDAFSTIWRIEEMFCEATLLTYDVAQRFGYYREMQPKEVYLHAGASAGAQALGIVGLRVARERFGPTLGALDADDIENFLCIYKAQLSVDLLRR